MSHVVRPRSRVPRVSGVRSARASTSDGSLGPSNVRLA